MQNIASLQLGIIISRIDWKKRTLWQFTAPREKIITINSSDPRQTEVVPKKNARPADSARNSNSREKFRDSQTWTISNPIPPAMRGNSRGSSVLATARLRAPFSGIVASEWAETRLYKKKKKSGGGGGGGSAERAKGAIFFSIANPFRARNGSRMLARWKSKLSYGSQAGIIPNHLSPRGRGTKTPFSVHQPSSFLFVLRARLLTLFLRLFFFLFFTQFVGLSLFAAIYCLILTDDSCAYFVSGASALSLPALLFNLILWNCFLFLPATLR